MASVIVFQRLSYICLVTFFFEMLLHHKLKFLKVIFRYRSDVSFRQNLLAGKVMICGKHKIYPKSISYN